MIKKLSVLCGVVVLLSACTTTKKQVKPAQSKAVQATSQPTQKKPMVAVSDGSPYVLGAKWTYNKVVTNGSNKQETKLYRIVKALERGASGFIRVAFVDGSRINVKGEDVYTFERTFPGNFTTMTLQYKAAAPKTYKSIVHGKDVEVKSSPIASSLKMDAGTFENCMTYVASGPNFERTTVRCKGVGMVRQSDVFFNKDKAPTTKTVVTLVSYERKPDNSKTTP